MKFKRTILNIALLMAVPMTVMAEGLMEASSFSEAITDGKLSGNFRLRYENVNQGGKTENAEAFTLRSVIGYETKAFHGFSVNAEAYGVSPFNDGYNDMKKGYPIASRKKYPTIADPEDYDFQQLYLQWANASNKVKLGRQIMDLDNRRFVGDSGFRQNFQVFNGVSLLNTSLTNTTINLAHFEQVKQVTTKIEDANIEIANVNYKLTPTTNLVGYGYLIDWNGSVLAPKSNKTYGMRLDGGEMLNEHWKVLYTAEYAKQDNYKDGSSLIDNYYYRVGAGAGFDGWFVRVDQEKLSGNANNRAFQTPIGTAHSFQGWADVFSGVPNEGIVDTMLIAGGQLMGVTLKTEYHVINSDRNFASVGGGTGDRYGTEFDFGAYYNFTKKISGSVEYADFREADQYNGSRKRDLEKVWVTAGYSF